MRKKILLILSFICLNSYPQEIKIVTVNEYTFNDQKNLVIKCELKNNSKSDKIVLPLPIQAIGNDNINHYNYFYKVETNPKDALIIEEAPPSQLTKSEKLKFKDILVCEPNSTVIFEIDTKYFMDSTYYFDKKINIKQIRLIYQPWETDEFDKRNCLSDELINTQFCSKKIQSKPYNLRK